MKEAKIQFKRAFLEVFKHTATENQTEAIDLLCEFTSSDQKFKCFILSGYAGTGKTALIGSFVTTLKQFNRKTVLMAPTGRAAKIFSGFAKQKAFTIHKRIYRKQKIENGSMKLVLA